MCWFNHLSASEGMSLMTSEKACTVGAFMCR